MVLVEPFDTRQLIAVEDLELGIRAISHQRFVVELRRRHEDSDGHVRYEHKEYGVTVVQHDRVEEGEDECVDGLNEANEETRPLVVELLRMVAHILHDGEAGLEPR